MGSEGLSEDLAEWFLQLSGWSAGEKVEIYSPSQLVFKLLYPAHGVSVVLFVQWA